MRLQTDEPRESLEEALARANAEALSVKKAPLLAVDITDQHALKTLAMEALVEIVQTAPRNVSLVGAVRELIDRCEGKAPQAIHMKIERTPVEKLTDDQLAAILAALPNNPIIIPPLPKKLECD